MIVSLSAARLLPAQGVALNTDGSNPNASALLDMKSTTQGFLPPRMTAAQRMAIPRPANGLTVYQIDADSGLWYYDGSQWEGLARRSDVHPNAGITYLPHRDDPGMAAKGYQYLGRTEISNETISWTKMTNVNNPSDRAFHAAVWTGDRMIIWGGENNNSALGDGKLYDPATDTWSNMSSTGAPAARTHFSYVWTGSKLIVWGGSSGSAIGGGSSTLYNDGGIYDPVLDSWTTMATNGAPSVRSHHTAVWTGTEMIVFGGIGPLVSFNISRRYNPATNSWSTVSATNIPSNRNGHTALWTGSQMIIWGGQSGSSYLNTGGLYDPTTNTWTTMDTSHHAPGRIGHGAVWVDSLGQLIVFGGYGSAGNIGTNGVLVYTLSSDNWDIRLWLSPFGSGSKQSAFNSTIWTGEKMITWGGLRGVYGLIYAPAYPYERDLLDGSDQGLWEVFNPSAVWTGEKMLVFGGDESNWFDSYDASGRGWIFDPFLNFSQLYLYIKL